MDEGAGLGLCGDGLGLHGELRRLLGDVFLGAAFAGYEDLDALEELYGRGCAFGQEGVGGEGAVEGGHGAADDERGERGVHLLGAADEFVAVHAGQEQVRDEEVEGALGGLFQDFERLVRGGGVDDAVATGFKEKGAD